MSTNPAAHSSRPTILKYRPKEPDVVSTPRQSWQRNSPASLIRGPVRFTSDEDRQFYRQGIRTLTLVYAGILVLVVAVTVLRGGWSKPDVTAKANVGAVDISRR